MSKLITITIVLFLSTVSAATEEFSDENFIKFMYDEPTQVPTLTKEHIQEYFRECQAPEDKEYNKWKCMKLEVIIQNYIETH